MMAAQGGHMAVVEELVKGGADLNIQYEVTKTNTSPTPPPWQYEHNDHHDANKVFG